MIIFMENNKKYTEEEIKNWEKNNNIFLPHDYKNFILNIGIGEFIFDFLNNNEIFYNDIFYVNKNPPIEEIHEKNNSRLNANYKYYSLEWFFNLDNIIEENFACGNYEPNNSSLLIFAGLANNEFFSMCINKNDTNYGKIYYTKSGYHYTFDYLQDKPQEYENLPFLENTFNNFIENIEVFENL